MKPTEELVHDHTIILHMLAGAEKLAQSIKTTRTVDPRNVERMIDFSRNFTDGCHHTKEEKHLFPKLQERGMPANQGPIAVMLHEHRVGRDLIKGIESALNVHRSGRQDALDLLSETILQYVGLLRAHIDKENNVLFPMSDRFLSPDDQKSLEESFKFIEEHEVGRDVHEKYHQMAHQIGE
jgi:hemerythrin-like domain-containing protein